MDNEKDASQQEQLHRCNLNPPRSYAHPSRHRKQVATHLASAETLADVEKSNFSTFVFVAEQKDQRLKNTRLTTKVQQQQAQSRKQHQPKKDIPCLLQVVNNERSSSNFQQLQKSWSSAGAETISSLSNSFENNRKDTRNSYQKLFAADIKRENRSKCNQKDMAHNTTTSTTNFIRRPNLDFKKNLRRICKTKTNTKVHTSTAFQRITTLRAKDSSSFFSFFNKCSSNFLNSYQDQTSTASSRDTSNQKPVKTCLINNAQFVPDANIYRNPSLEHHSFHAADEQLSHYQSFAELAARDSLSSSSSKSRTRKNNITYTGDAAKNKSISWWDKTDDSEGFNATADGGYPHHRDEATNWSCPKKNNRGTLNGNNSNENKPNIIEKYDITRKNDNAQAFGTSPVSTTTTNSQERRKTVQPARLIIDDDENILSILVSALSRICAA